MRCWGNVELLPAFKVFQSQGTWITFLLINRCLGAEPPMKNYGSEASELEAICAPVEERWNGLERDILTNQVVTYVAPPGRVSHLRYNLGVFTRDKIVFPT